MQTKLVVIAAGCALSLWIGCSDDVVATASTPKKSTTGQSKTASKAGAAGAAAKGAAGSGTTAAPTDVPQDTAYPDIRGNCSIDSGFPGDETCILPPAAEEGMQIHVGPTDYKDMDQINKFVFHPGEEAAECWTFHTPNKDPIYYQNFVISGRPGTHHIISTMYKVEMTDGGFAMCADLGIGMNSNILDNLPGASRAYMPRAVVAPENAHIGRKVPGNTPSQSDMHYFNYTDKDILREFWMNIYYVPQQQIEQEATQIRGMGGLSWLFAPIQPGTDKTYSYQCPIGSDGRIIALLGHYHSHGKHFTASLKHANGDIEKVFEMYDYLEPAIFQYDSVAMNPPFSDTGPGATSGAIAVTMGDALLWDCHVMNDSTVALSYTNNVRTGEMCNLWGETVGPKIDCVLQ
jgi:hypothetical protein